MVLTFIFIVVYRKVTVSYIEGDVKMRQPSIRNKSSDRPRRQDLNRSKTFSTKGEARKYTPNNQKPLRHR